MERGHDRQPAGSNIVHPATGSLAVQHCVDKSDVVHGKTAEKLGEPAHLIRVGFQIPHLLEDAGLIASFEIDTGEGGEGISECEALLNEFLDLTAQAAIHSDTNETFELFANELLLVECGFHYYE